VKEFISNPDPRQAKPSKKLLGLLGAIAAKPHTTLCIVTGRTREALNLWFGDTSLSMAAEHGAWIKHNGEWLQADTSFHATKRQLLVILKRYANRTTGSYVEEKDFSLVWHYRQVPAELAYVRTTNLKRELRQLLLNSDVGIYSGNKIVEIKPKTINKGQAVSKLLALNPADFILCIGDDYTDEDMFKALPETAFTLKVGPGVTAAHYRVPGIEGAIEVLNGVKDL
jgi:trehalose 6-phosphate synthase/phosphatase